MKHIIKLKSLLTEKQDLFEQAKSAAQCLQDLGFEQQENSTSTILFNNTMVFKRRLDKSFWLSNPSDDVLLKELMSIRNVRDMVIQKIIINKLDPDYLGSVINLKCTVSSISKVTTIQFSYTFDNREMIKQFQKEKFGMQIFSTEDAIVKVKPITFIFKDCTDLNANIVKHFNIPKAKTTWDLITQGFKAVVKALKTPPPSKAVQRASIGGDPNFYGSTKL